MNITIVGFGDSLTYGYGVDTEDTFLHRLQKDLPLQFPPHTFTLINAGINGFTTRESLAYLERNVLWKSPHFVLILLGSNDSALNEGQYRTPYEYEKNLRFMIEEIKKVDNQSCIMGGHPLPILITPPPVVDTDFFPFTTTDRIEKYGTIVKKLARELDCPIFDFFSLLLAEKENAYESYFQYDGVHLSKKGYAFLYLSLQSFLFPLLQEKINP